MLDLTKKVMPETIMVSGVSYKLKTDYQYWLTFALKLKHKNITDIADLYYLFDGKHPQGSDIETFKALHDFYAPPKALPRSVGSGSDSIILDFELDADYIYAAFMEQYHIDLISPETHLHWYKFNALFDSLHNTKLNDIMSYRAYDSTDKSSYEQQMTKLRQAWEIIKPLSDEEQKALDAFDAQLK